MSVHAWICAPGTGPQSFFHLLDWSVALKRLGITALDHRAPKMALYICLKKNRWIKYRLKHLKCLVGTEKLWLFHTK